MAGNYDMHIIRYAEGAAHDRGKASNKTVSWKAFRQKFSKKKLDRSGESFDKYLSLKAGKQKDTLKSRAGWYLGAMVEDGVRKKANIRDRDIITLDLDNLSVEDYESITVREGHWLNQFEMVWHTTRSHSPEAPRLRIIILSSDPVPPEEYRALTKIMAWHCDESMNTVDPVSFKPAQLMYNPSASRDQEYLAKYSPGEILVPLEILEAWPTDWRDYRNLPHHEKENKKHAPQEKAEDPHEKRGIIGAFCRAYGIHRALDELIPGTYGDPDPTATDDRLSYLHGTSQFGAIIYDDKFLYSHHGSDPVGDTETSVNAWDLVRIHKFGDKDAKFDDDADVDSLPSQKEMKKWAQGLSAVNQQLAAEKIDLEAHLDDLDDLGVEDYAVQVDEDDFAEEEDEETRELLGLEPKAKGTQGLPEYPGKVKKVPDDKDWRSDLEATLQGDIKPTVANLTKIFLYDRRFRGLMAINAFTGEMVATRSFKTKMRAVKSIPIKDTKNGDIWSDYHDAAIMTILSAPSGQGNAGYGLSPSRQAVNDALVVAAQHFTWHPVIDHITALPEWDGVERLDRVWIDYMGTPDSPYHRESSRMLFMGALARMFAPGMAFDFVPILISTQGKRKSTFVEHLGFDIWGGELTADFHKEQLAAEQMMGKLFLELSEITNMRRADAQAQKSFITRKKDKVRLAYDRRAREFPRQSIFVGTTNEFEFLRDHENRRYWPIKMRIESHIDTERFLRERNQIWAEALVAYKEAYAKAGDPARIFFGFTPAAKAEAELIQDSVRVQTHEDSDIAALEDFLDTPVPISQIMEPQGVGAEFESEDGEATALRVMTCTQQLLEEGLNEDLATNQHAKQSRATVIGAHMSRVPGWIKYSDWCLKVTGGKGKMRLVPGYGRQYPYVREDATEQEVALGYREIEVPEDDLL